MMTSDQTDEQIDDDPFLLLSQAKVWLRSELERYEENPRSCCGMLAGRGPTSAYSQQDGSNTTVVMDAVSFGTEDLSEDNKNEFFEPRANRLVGVDRWRRPQDEDDPNWNITLPFRGFLYKVAKKQKVVKKKRKTTHIIVYVLDEIDEGAEVDFTMDLRKMVREFESAKVPKGLPVEMISESDHD